MEKKYYVRVSLLEVEPGKDYRDGRDISNMTAPLVGMTEDQARWLHQVVMRTAGSLSDFTDHDTRSKETLS